MRISADSATKTTSVHTLYGLLKPGEASPLKGGSGKPRTAFVDQGSCPFKQRTSI